MELIYQNDRGDALAMDTRAASETPYKITNIDGLFGLPVNVYAYDQYGLDGETLESSQVPARHATISIRIRGDVVENRIRALSAMKLKEWATLTLVRRGFSRRLRFRIEQAPDVNTKRGDEFVIGVVALDPYWHDVIEARQDVAVWTPLFEWPLDIPAETGIDFGERATNQITNVINEGDVEVGMRVTLTATGTVARPYVAHALTGEKMLINTTLTAGDVVTIQTGFGTSSVYIRRAGSAADENAFKYWDAYNDFIVLEPGDNLLRYDADNGAAQLNVAVHWSPGYLGV